MSKHTLGPWLIADDGTIEAKHLGRVGFLTHAAPADAALIAAAPELLRDLRVARELLRKLHYAGPERDTIDATIAKAEGRS